MICANCQSSPQGGFYDFKLDCCLTRFWANAPRHVQRAEYAGIVATEGKQAANEWAAKVKGEIQRIKGAK